MPCGYDIARPMSTARHISELMAIPPRVSGRDTFRRHLIISYFIRCRYYRERYAISLMLYASTTYRPFRHMLSSRHRSTRQDASRRASRNARHHQRWLFLWSPRPNTTRDDCRRQSPRCIGRRVIEKRSRRRYFREHDASLTYASARKRRHFYFKTVGSAHAHGGARCKSRRRKMRGAE